MRKGEVLLKSATQKRNQNRNLAFAFCVFVLLVLPAVFIVTAPLFAVIQPRYSDFLKMNAFSPQASVGIGNEKQLASGKFLVADHQLTDTNFRETVVLLIHYGPDGAMGLVINRPVQIDLSIVVPDLKELYQRKGTLHLGGPVHPNSILLLVRTANPPESSIPVFDDVYLSSNQELLQRLIKNPTEEERFQIYAGYAGWAPDQLESEYNRGHWHVLNADSVMLFDKDSSEIWKELINRTSVKWVRTNNYRELLEHGFLNNPVRRNIGTEAGIIKDYSIRMIQRIIF
jgi:putative transcriptional regulator